jgi:hypothetical protein
MLACCLSHLILTLPFTCHYLGSSTYYFLSYLFELYLMLPQKSMFFVFPLFSLMLYPQDYNAGTSLSGENRLCGAVRKMLGAANYSSCL